MDRNSIVRCATAFAMYVALVLAHLANISSPEFVLFAALVLGVGLCVHSIDFVVTGKQALAPGSGVGSVVPSLTESVAQLKVLQTDINELQNQFTAENELRDKPYSPNRSAG